MHFRGPPGEILILRDDGFPFATVTTAAAALKTPRPFGLCAGEFEVPDDFNDPLPDDILNDFTG